MSQTIELSRQDIRYRQLPLLLANVGGLRFENKRSKAGPIFRTRHSAGGMAAGDYDDGGDGDVVFVRLNETPVLLRNNVGQDAAWVGFELQDAISSRDAIVSKLSLRVGDKRFVKRLAGGASFLSFHDKRAVFGLGKNPESEAAVDIRRSNGQVQTVSGLKRNRCHKIVEPGEAPGRPSVAARPCRGEAERKSFTL